MKHQRQLFYLCESEAVATKCFNCAKAKRQQQNVLTVRKRSDSNKAPSRNRN
ncbi:hypothetical protein LAV73_12155 [Lysinibacillus xylanilyticus]|uniref:hypothetical protein n=1 Tax=Lysinibacillus xylanilyticus TaxID=582475 RepID=UPI002B24E991|nr:hypothetical protein [Lysinibacillus xylanilyticus]MEB2280749.1 hypothetical protein [Lysinibacillus xylanilyticus]